MHNTFYPSSNKRIPALDLVIFFRQLAALISSGIPIIQSCEIIRHNKPKSLQMLIIAIKTNMEAGNELSWSLSKFPRYFDTLICHLIQIGEHSGTLPMTLDRIALYKENVLSIRKKIKQAFLYPLFVMIVALLVTITMLTVVVPQFSELFQTMHSTLPAFTLGVIHLSQLIRDDYWLVVLLCFAIMIVTYYFRRSILLRRQIELLVLQIPYLGAIYQKTIFTRFCRTLAATFAAGIPISDSLKTIAYISHSYLYTQAILKLRTQIMQGQQLHHAMKKQAFFPLLLVQMIRTGEESGTLEKMLEKIATIYEADIDYFVSTCGHLLEPLIIVILGVLIGGLVIAMYLPIFKLGTVMR